MSTGPTTEYRMELSSLGIVCGLVASTLLIVVMIMVWRQGRRGPVLFSLTGLVAITVGLSASAAVHLVGLTRDTDTSSLVLAIQFGGTAIALALLTMGLVRQRRGSSVR
jgi:hypothetical protein